ncbi:DUF1694 domain-containing protein [Streptococcus sp. X16XC17]|uniref:YueI family protein n=1 Tax=unclassified Streptococcus TaxID=2608887 RepID=UPI00066FDE59|nr:MULTISPECIES: YueI family protein [unclassified Streptococcus]TCD46223.1 DUF1694 domain-containing protein [Streptococcus sp. X16XC17]
MTDLNKTILQKATGENRLDPDQQKRYLGTFRERVVLALSFEEAISDQVQTQFDLLCKKLMHYQPLFLKISPRLSDFLQVSYMKIAQDQGIQTAIIDEATADSPYALLFHSDHALDLEDIGLETVFPQNTSTENQEEKTPKKISFWKKLFG